MPASLPAPRPTLWRSPLWLGLFLLTALAVLLAVYHYFTGDDAALPVQAVAQLKPVPTILTQVRVGLAALPVRVNGYLLTQTHDLVGPYVRPEAAYALLLLLAGALVYFLAVVSTLPRIGFVAGMAGLIFLLMSLNADLLGIFNSQEQYFLILMLVVLVLPAYGFHAFRENTPLGTRLAVFLVLVAGLSALLLYRSELPLEATALHLASFTTNGGAVITALLVLWVAVENINGLLWFNTQAENPGSRFGLLPFVLASLLYLGTLGLYLWNDGDLLLLPGLHLDPLVLLLPAVAIGWLGLQRREASYGDWLPYKPGAAYLYLVLVLLAAAFVGYAFATANDPLLLAARHFTAWALFAGGLAYLLYILLNFAPLIRQRLRVYRVVYAPRRLPFFIVYVIGIGVIIAVELRHNIQTVYQVQAGYYNNLGDLTRLQSELEPEREGLALLAERYYAESDILDEHNHKASLGRAALYRFRLQRQNEINILRRALSRRPSEKISLRLASLYNEPTDFFDRLAALREGLKSTPTSARLNNDLAHLYSRSTLSDSVNWYLNRAEAADPGNAVLQTNRLAFLLQNGQVAAAQQLIQDSPDNQDAAWQSNVLLLAQQAPALNTAQPKLPAPDTAANLTVPEFARLYHAALQRAATHDTTYLPALTKLVQRPSNEAYFEQLTFLRALTQHYGGSSMAARTTLAPLMAGNTASAAYYQNMAALWLLELHAPGAAATNFGTAARTGPGYPEARLNRAYALALNQQTDSARAAVAALLADPDTAVQRPVRALQRVLALEYPQQYAAAPDADKAQFLTLRGHELPAQELSAAAEIIRNTVARQVAGLAQVSHSIRSGQLSAAKQLLARLAPKATQRQDEASAWNIERGNLLLREKNTAELRQLTESGYFAPADQPYRLYFRAALADNLRQSKQAEQLYRRLRQEAPFLEPGMLAAADFYARQQDYLGAYGVLQAALEVSPASVPLLKAYALAAIPAGLSEYATASLDKLRPLLSPAEYTTFRTLYDARRAAQAAAAAPWN
ncbi:hypothetical protein [Hymenobacter psychrotolerans]|uniref:Tetratricopeptide repeat-containing protein n=1 Tax=Hymenobacter psychrotolerans DSM 18569 TaxID=1121959 RepID=A0A1M6TW36_9BACT|nr:hypothetical protein [Hymenobacter psychrotolerans]SHK61232.1 hypothetical protein SAMN02746009_01242 [Hymenobacter psychrotolerans DSM 18569]